MITDVGMAVSCAKERPGNASAEIAASCVVVKADKAEVPNTATSLDESDAMSTVADGKVLLLVVTDEVLDVEGIPVVAILIP
jgi:hypothetical protein